MLVKIIHNKKIVTNADNYVKKEKPLITASKGANCYSHYRNQYGDSTKTYKLRPGTRAQKLGIHTALAEDPNSVPRIQVG